MPSQTPGELNSEDYWPSLLQGDGSDHTRNAAIDKGVGNVAVSQFLKESSIGVHIELFLEVNAELRKDLRDYSLFAWPTLDVSRDDDSASGADDSFKFPHNSTRIWKQMDDITRDDDVEGGILVVKARDVSSFDRSIAIFRKFLPRLFEHSLGKVSSDQPLALWRKENTDCTGSAGAFKNLIFEANQLSDSDACSVIHAAIKCVFEEVVKGRNPIPEHH